MNIKKILLGSFAIVTATFAMKSFDSIFPESNIEMSKSRKEIFEIADREALKLGFDDSYRKAMVMREDSSFLNYANLELEGLESVNKANSEKGYNPYSWSVRYLKDYDIKDLYISISLKGELLGFNINIPEDEVLENISERDARNIVLKELSFFNNQIEKEKKQDYIEVEYSFVKQQNGRVDHIFVFENEEKIHEGDFRYIIEVSGNKVSGVKLIFKQPMSFIKKYRDITANNIKLSQFSLIFIVMMAIVGAIFFLRYISLKKLFVKFPIKLSLLLAFGSFISFILSLRYDIYYHSSYTSFSINILKRLVAFLTSRVSAFIYCFFMISLAISIDQEAFPEHVSIKSILNKKFIASKEYLELMFRGYVIGLLDILAVFAFYYVAIHLFNWKTGLSFFNSKTYSSAFPSINLLLTAFNAGFFEEILFRVLPISLGIILAKKYNKKIIVPIFIFLQAIIFSAAHANYPTLPFYFRLVELIIPSLIFALAYWRCGLITGFIAHFVYDAIVFCSPIFKNIKFFGYAPAIASLLLLISPFILHLGYRFYGIFSEVVLNKDLKADSKFIEFSLPKLSVKESDNYFIVFLLLITGISNIDWKVKNTNTSLIKEKAINFIKEKGLPEYSYNYLYSSNNTPSKFILKHHGDRVEELNSKGLFTPSFTYVSKDWDKRRNFSVKVDRSGNILGYISFYDEAIPFESVTKKEAEKISRREIEDLYGLSNLQIIESFNQKRVNRNDWSFIFKEDDLLRVSIHVVGNRVSSISRYVFTPQSFYKGEADNNSYLHILFNILNIYQYLTYILLFLILLKNFKLSFGKNSIYFFSTICVLHLLPYLNEFYIYKGSISLYSNFVTSTINLVMGFSIEIAKSILSLAFLVIAFRNIGISRDIGEERSLKSSLIFAIGMNWISRLTNLLYDNSNIGLFNGISTNINLFHTMVNNMISFVVPIIFVMIIANYFKNRLISFMMFFIYFFHATIYSHPKIEYVIALALLKAIILYISFEVGWKYSPSLALFGSMFYILLKYCGYILHSNFLLGYFASAILISYFVMIFVKKNRFFEIDK